MLSTRARGERGAAAVEFALVVPLLAMLLIGVISVAVVYNQKLALANAVREGARIGATLPSGGTWGSSVQTHVANALADPGDPAATNLNVCAKLYKDTTVLQTVGSGCGTEPGAPAGVSGCYVKVWASRPASMDWMLGRGSFTLRSSSVAIYDRSLSCV